MRRGQATASGAGGLIAIITGLIILYILFLPAQDRAELLADNITDDENVTRSGRNATILSEGIGRVDFLEDNEFEKSIPNIFLRQTTSAEVLAEFNPFVVRNGWFDKQKGNLSFKIDDLDLTSNVQLTFGAQTNEGILTIELNGRKIFEQDIESYNVDPIPLDASMLQEINDMTFSVSDVGGAFWKTNEYQLDNIQVLGDVSDISGQTASTVFVMEGFEFFNMKNAKLRFTPYCRGVTDVGPLEIDLNNRRIFDSIPLCDELTFVNIPITHFNAGQNNIRFKTTEGSYAVEEIELTGDLEEVGGVIKYFDIEEEELEDIADEKIVPRLYITFIDDEERKRATVNVNGHLNEVDTRGATFNWTLTSYVQQENNYVKIDPKTTLEIVSLKVSLDKE